MKSNDICTWKIAKEFDNVWPDENTNYIIGCREGQADELFYFCEGGPKENHHNYCHRCGRPIVVDAN